MNNKVIKYITLLSLPVALLSSCKKDPKIVFNQDFAGIYFETDSINYSFSVTPLDIHSYLLKVPVEIMGNPSPQDRTFGIEIITGDVTDSTTAPAEEGVQYTIDGELAIPADSIQGFIPVLINRNSLDEKDYRIRLKLIAKNGFTPVNQPLDTTIIVFNNRVEPPKWKDWQGLPTWPDFKLGQWNPLTYIKFIELFRGLKDIVPETYKAMVDLYGEDLEHVDLGWPWDYDNTMNKYVLIPLYQYFMEQHPELGVVIPRPSGY